MLQGAIGSEESAARRTLLMGSGTPLSLDVAIESLIPHRAPFRFVDEVVSVTNEEGEFALILGPDDQRLAEPGVASLLLLEALAQSSAAFHGLSKRREGNLEPESGFLVQIDRARLKDCPQPGDRVRLVVRRARVFGALVQFQGWAWANETLLVEACFSVARSKDPTFEVHHG